MLDLYERLRTYDPLWENWHLNKGGKLGRGGFGAVYKYSRDMFGLHEESAVKVIEQILLQEYLDDVERIDKIKKDTANDILIMDKFKGEPNIMPLMNYAVKDIYDDEKNIIGFDILIQMEICSSIKSYYVGNVSVEDIERLAVQIGGALKTIHNKGVMHRDIKVDNILIDNKGDFVLTDFGISKENLEYSTFISRAGTKAYMAPEVYENDGHGYKKNADIYSYGMSLYCLLNNWYLPNTSETSSMTDRAMAIEMRLKGEAFSEPVRGDKRLKDIVMKCVEYYPEKRYQQMEEVLEDINRCIGKDTFSTHGKRGPVFNSERDSEAFGDERHFCKIKEAGTDSKYKNEIKLEAGKEYEVSVYFRNDADPSKNEDGSGIARGVRISSVFPDRVTKASPDRISATILSSNTEPKEVRAFSAVSTDCAKGISLEYVPGSAIIHNSGKLSGTVMPESIFTKEGAYIGYNSFSGIIPGGDEYSGNITYRLKCYTV